jgi:urease accessory protein
VAGRQRSRILDGEEVTDTGRFAGVPRSGGALRRALDAGADGLTGLHPPPQLPYRRRNVLGRPLIGIRELDMMLRISCRVLAILLVMLTPALAHTGVGDTTGFAHGFIHPTGGIDHVLAMVAVGLFAALLGGRALLLVPASFVAMMVGGGALGVAGVSIPFVEIGIGLSVVVFGAAIALRFNMRVAAAMVLVGVFAIFHGHAHGAEMPDTASGIEYGLGFVLATAVLHAAGIGFGLAIEKSERHGQRIAQAAGGSTALAGAAILAHLI